MGLAYVYCDYRDQYQQTTENIYGAILKQLLRRLPSVPTAIEQGLQKLHAEQKPLELGQGMHMLRTICGSFDRTYICLDALDECQHLDRLLNSLQKAPASVFLFCTGRSHILRVVQNCFPKSGEMIIKAEDSDIKLLIKERINNDRKINSEIMDKALERDIVEQISSLSGGMFVINVLEYMSVADSITDFFYLRFTLALFLTSGPSEIVGMP